MNNEQRLTNQKNRKSKMTTTQGPGVFAGPNLYLYIPCRKKLMGISTDG